MILMIIDDLLEKSGNILISIRKDLYRGKMDEHDLMIPIFWGAIPS